MAPPSAAPHGATERLGRGLLLLLRAYWLDWLSCFAVGTAAAAARVFLPTHQRHVSEHQLLHYLHAPYGDETVPSWTLPIFALLIPGGVIFALGFRRRASKDMHQAFLGLAWTVALTFLVTNFLKSAIGRPRPDFFNRCFPDGKTHFAADGNVECTGAPRIVQEGRRSFPSGHSSEAFAGLGYLALYLAGKLGLADRQGHLWRALVAVLPLAAGTFVALSRLRDYKHHWQDVLVGTLLGLGAAEFCYRQYFPPVLDPQGFRPLPVEPAAVEMDTERVLLSAASFARTETSV